MRKKRRNTAAAALVVAAVFVCTYGDFCFINKKEKGDKKMKRIFKTILTVVMVLVMAFTLAACGGAPEEVELITVEDGTAIGEGANEFALEIVDADGSQINVTVKTDEKTVGDALSALGLIAGEESQYGLYIKTVNGITYDYETDGRYWAFYVAGTYAVESADLTEIEPGTIYALKAE